jgi:RimJ/RimL family protein N-acetyltransferase
MSGWIAEEVESQGYMTEAGEALVPWAFSALPINRITAWNMVRNPASGRVLRKLGFTQEGCLRQMVRKWGVFEDVWAWSRLRSDHARSTPDERS